MKRLSEKLAAITQRAESRFKDFTENDWRTKNVQGKWNKKEILGHLIDSAANNHQRFVRLQYQNNPIIFYHQNNWVAAQNYTNTEIDNTVSLFVSYNLHLAHIISNIPEEYAGVKCVIENRKQVSLEWLVRDYINHLMHHLKQI